MKFSEFLKTNRVYLDGGMGTLLQSRGLRPGELPERWNLTHKDEIVSIQKAYFDAGCHVVSANTFGANLIKFSKAELADVIKAAMENAHAARAQSERSGEKFVALDIGPTGKLLKPYGDLDFEEAVALFAETVKLGVANGADLILIETMNDSYETKAALLAARENADLPVLVTNAYGEDGKLMTGATPAAMVAMLEGMGADGVGVNCSYGPKALAGVVEELLRCASVPVVVKPNAGLPTVADGQTVYDMTASDFAADMAVFAKAGVGVLGGCCGTTPAYLEKLVEMTKDVPFVPLTDKGETVVSSYTHAVAFGDKPLLIGERINPTGKKRFKEAIVQNDMDYIWGEGIRQQEAGAHILDVNVGLPGIDEAAFLEKTVCGLQAITNLPLQIDTSDSAAMEAALRRYNGKALVNSVNGKAESMAAIFPLVKKYGGVVIALTLDEDGIPATVEGRFSIAEKILSVAARYGIDKKDIVFDTLTMAVSADPAAARVTLQTLARIRGELGCHTLLGVSNISFGLPNRDAVNSTFFTMALQSGLSAAILNPHSTDMIKAYSAFCALAGKDENCEEYIRKAQVFASAPAQITTVAKSGMADENSLRAAIIRGLTEKAAALAERLLGDRSPFDLVEQEIIPALNFVGEGFEKGTLYLPQLLRSAEAAKCAFARMKAHMEKDSAPIKGGHPIVLATVEGDIHDIGKNIVKLLLENYGFAVEDLGRDVPAERVVEAVVRLRAPLCGLSALMTTTVPAMEKTIEKLRENAPFCKVVVGGAVLTEEYAARIGADKYAKDAMETVRYAESLVK